MKLSPPIRIAIGFAALVGTVAGGSAIYNRVMTARIDLNPIKSSPFCLVAIKPGSGVSVVTANQIAKLVVSSNAFEAQNSGEDGPTEGATKLRVPVPELLAFLDGDASAFKVLVNKLAEFKGDVEINENSEIWTESDVLSAISTAGPKRTKLENDLGMSMDGIPNGNMNKQAIFVGIRIQAQTVIDAPNASGKPLTVTLEQMFRPAMYAQLLKQLEDKFYDDARLQKEYLSLQQTAKLDKNLRRLDASLKDAFSALKSTDQLGLAKKVVNKTVVLVNQSHIESAEVKFDPKEKDGASLVIKLTSEGSDRLWKYSVDGGNQILVVSKGVPIAAANVTGALASKELVINQIPNRKLVEDACEIILTGGK